MENTKGIAIVIAVVVLTGCGSNNQSGQSVLARENRFALTQAKQTALSVSSFPIDSSNNVVAPLEAATVPPGGTVTWYLSGPPGLQVTISLSRQENSGGHSHGGGPTGTVTPSSFTLGGNYPQNVPQVFRAPDAAGVIVQVASGGGQSVSNVNNVVVNGLVALAPSSGVSLVGSTGTHPSNHWGTPVLVQAIGRLGQAFYDKFHKNLFVNDMSLQAGGLLDFQATWAPPHQLHRDGHEVDINWSTMTEEERTWFKTTAEGLGFSVQIDPNPNHWHLHI